MKKIISALIFIAVSATVHAQTYVNKTLHFDSSGSGIASPQTIPSTGSGNNIYVLFLSASQPTSVTVGSQTLTKSSTCANSIILPYNGSVYYTQSLCMWFLENSVAGVTQVSWSGGSGITSIYEYEYSGMNTIASLDQQNSCSSSSQSYCGTTITPTQPNEVIIAGFSCDPLYATGATGITGTGATFANVVDGGSTSYSVTGRTIVSSTSSVTATVNSGCISTSKGETVEGAIWSFKGAGAASTGFDGGSFETGELDQHKSWEWLGIGY